LGPLVLRGFVLAQALADKPRLGKIKGEGEGRGKGQRGANGGEVLSMVKVMFKVIPKCCQSPEKPPNRRKR